MCPQCGRKAVEHVGATTDHQLVAVPTYRCQSVNCGATFYRFTHPANIPARRPR